MSCVVASKGQVVKVQSPLDLRYWYEMMIPALEEVARFSLKHPSVKGATIDWETYGFDPFKMYPQAIGFEDVSYSAFLRAAAGHLDDATIAEAATLIPAQRYTWLRDRGLLHFFFLLLENESEKLGRIIRQRIHAINPDFIFGAYQAALPDTWFYRGIIRGMSTPEMPMIWMSFQVHRRQPTSTGSGRTERTSSTRPPSCWARSRSASTRTPCRRVAGSTTGTGSTATTGWSTTQRAEEYRDARFVAGRGLEVADRGEPASRCGRTETCDHGKECSDERSWRPLDHESASGLRDAMTGLDRPGRGLTVIRCGKGGHRPPPTDWFGGRCPPYSQLPLAGTRAISP